MNENETDLEFRVFMQPTPNKKKCKKVINNVLIRYIQGNINSSDVDNYFSMVSRFGHRLQKQRDNYYKINIEKKDNCLPL